MLSIWQRTAFHADPHLAVVGGGIVGLFTALHYQRRHPHHRVLVLERGPFPSGATVKNAGFACFGSPSELLADLDKEGADAMLQRVDERYQGLRELRAELGDAAIGFEPTGGHEVYPLHDPLYTHVAERFDALNDLLTPLFGGPVYRWNPEGFRATGMQGPAHMASNDREGAVDSGMLVRALLTKVAEAGVLVRTGAEVVGFEEGAQAVNIRLSDGSEVHAAQVVVATNAWTRQLLPDLEVVPARGQVLLTEPIPGLALRGTFFRDHHGAVLLGGGRELDFAAETTWQEGFTPVVQEALEHLLRTLILPGRTVRIAHRWSGIMGMGPTKAPIVQRCSPRVVAAVRLGGMGVAIGIRVARTAAGLVGE